MAKGSSLFLFLLFLCNAVTSSDILHPHAKDFEVVWEKKQLFPSIRRALMEYFRYRMTELDSIDPPTTTALPSPPITNPVTAPPINTAPGVVTVPGANPVNPPPATNPINPPVPVTNPVTTPSTTPTGSGGNGRWCIAKNGASQAALQSALDYACGIGGADCATIQQGSSCYEPATLQNHASYAFNSYYQKNPAPTSCDFGGAAVVTTTNPSTGSCVYPSSSPPQAPANSTSLPTSPPTASLPTAPPTATSPPTTSLPTAPPTATSPPTTSLPTAPPTATSPPAASLPTAPPTTTSSSGPGTQYPPPSGFSLGNPDPTGLGAYGASPPVMNTASVSNNQWPFFIGSACIVMFGL